MFKGKKAKSLCAAGVFVLQYKGFFSELICRINLLH